jgi:hypothetical protein
MLHACGCDAGFLRILIAATLATFGIPVVATAQSVEGSTLRGSAQCARVGWP